MSCSSCPNSNSMSTITLPSAGKCWSTTVNFVNSCIGLCDLESDYSPVAGSNAVGQSSSYIGFDYQVGCNGSDSYTINNSCNVQGSIPSTFTSFCPNKVVRVVPFIMSSNGTKYPFLPLNGTSALNTTTNSARAYRTSSEWTGPCILVNLNQSTNQACCQQIWNIYYQILPAGAPEVTFISNTGGILTLKLCPNTTCPLAPATNGNTTYSIDISCLGSPVTTGNVIIGIAGGTPVSSNNYKLEVNSTGIGGSLCGELLIKEAATTSTTLSQGTNTGNIDIAGNSCCILSVQQENANSLCTTPFTAPYLLAVGSS
jgi:hypothetical protein